ncbi:sulfatase-like hydrolase/transferase [Bordetella genomosp. 12]|uniref:Sulfatase n=1 Tax=Bordetella genomosp. 12 TaxID=463035 RepID=A0A261VBD5_9BORD|nr:sulfatase-like hydrolase/transferase [Bordetella genomosp. 12]OZI71305.1 sulfatase [Bordetella genomosp. 12]
MTRPLPNHERPNILLITSDQHRGDAYGFEGAPIHTPHLDAMARQGTRFSACITPNVVCQPARASMLTGLLPLTHGVHDNGIELEEEAASGGFAAELARAGYATTFIGKGHFSTYYTHAPTQRPENVAGSALYGRDWRGPYMGFDQVDMMLIGHNYWLPERAPRGLHYEAWYHGDGQGDLKDRLYRQRGGDDGSAAQTHHSCLPPVWHNSSWIGDRTVELLREHKRSGGKPFCAWASFPDPHHPFDAPLPWSLLHRPEDMRLPAHRTRDFDRRPWWHRAATETPPGVSGEMGRVRREYSRIEPQSDEQLRHMIANYYGMISLIDHNVGRILTTLDELDLSANTLVIFTSDHGEWLGDHGLVLKGPMFYEGLLRVGMVMRGPGVPAGKVVHDPVSTLDLAATMGDFAGHDIPAARHSRSLRPLLEDRQSREFAYSEWKLGAGRCGVALDLRAVRTRDAKLTLELGSNAGELYVLSEDPSEMHNRFDDPACKGLRDALTDMIHARPDDERDPLPQPIGTA